MDHDLAFRLSRVEAEGWKEAQRVMAQDALLAGEGRSVTLNPHMTDPERARWHAGFTKAIDAGGCR